MSFRSCFKPLFGTALLLAVIAHPATAQTAAGSGEVESFPATFSTRLVLPRPATTFGLDLGQALQQRHSNREFATTPLSMEEMADLCWAADGINRDNGKRTHPSAMGFQYVEVFPVNASGVFRYDAASHALDLVSSEPLLTSLAKQPWVASAPQAFVLTAHLKKLEKDLDRTLKLDLAYVMAGAMAQNLYLTAAARNLNVCICWGFTPEAVRNGLKIGPDQEILFLVMVGHKKP